MYNRYIPGNNGIYERRTVHEPQRRQELPVKECTVEDQQPCCQETPAKPCPKKSFLPQGIDTGDLLLLCIVLLLMMDSDEDDMLPLLITAVAFLFC